MTVGHLLLLAVVWASARRYGLVLLIQHHHHHHRDHQKLRNVDADAKQHADFHSSQIAEAEIAETADHRRVLRLAHSEINNGHDTHRTVSDATEEEGENMDGPGIIRK